MEFGRVPSVGFLKKKINFDSKKKHSSFTYKYYFMQKIAFSIGKFQIFIKK